MMRNSTKLLFLQGSLRLVNQLGTLKILLYRSQVAKLFFSPDMSVTQLHSSSYLSALKFSQEISVGLLDIEFAGHRV